MLEVALKRRPFSGAMVATALLKKDLGLALSGGGSRAAAFHSGVLRALDELDEVENVSTVSSVSGGSVFAAAWLVARAMGKDSQTFVGEMAQHLSKGFVRPALMSPRAFKLLLPGWSRTHRLGEVFDQVLLQGLNFEDLEPSPLLCLNTSVMNSGQAGRFSQGGFSSAGVGERLENGSYPEVHLRGVSLGLAAAASAAFPFGLPPLVVDASHVAGEFCGPLGYHKKLVFTDGGIVENLGVQTLLRSRRFGTPRIIVSDAGLQERSWQPKSFLARLRGAILYGLSATTLERLLVIMSDKQNRSMRQIAYRDRSPPESRYEGSIRFMRLAYNWKSALRDIPWWRLQELGIPSETTVGDLEAALEKAGVDLEVPRELYEKMGGDAAVREANGVATGFAALPGKQIRLLSAHAYWQVYFARAVFD